MAEQSNVNMRDYPLGITVGSIENIINDESKEKKPYWYNKRTFPPFVDRTIGLLHKIYWSQAGSIGYYGIPYYVDGEKTSAFYKSINSSIYHIEVENGVPISFYNIDYLING